MAQLISWPLVTSLLRLVFITVLTMCNWVALYRVINKKYRSGKSQGRLLVTITIAINLVYLSLVWTPFTYSALKHDLTEDYSKFAETTLNDDLNVSGFDATHIETEFETQPIHGLKIDLGKDLDVNIFAAEDNKFIEEYVDLLPSSKEYKSEDMKKQIENLFVAEFVDLLLPSSEEVFRKETEQVVGNGFVEEYAELLPSSQETVFKEKKHEIGNGFVEEYVELLPSSMEVTRKEKKQGSENGFVEEYVDLLPSSIEVTQKEKKQGATNEFIEEYVELMPSSMEVTQKEKKHGSEFRLAKANLELKAFEKQLRNTFIEESKAIKKANEKSEINRKSMENSPPSRQERAIPNHLESSWSVEYHPQPEVEDIVASPDVEVSVANSNDDARPKEINSFTWNTDGQDLVTSSCAYSLFVATAIRMILVRKNIFYPESSLAVGFWAGAVVGIPPVLVYFVRITNGVNHFAAHEPEYNSAGYFLYNFICDAYIDQEYVSMIFIECSVLLTLLVIMLPLMYYLLGDNTEIFAAKEGFSNLPIEDADLRANGKAIEYWTRDTVLLLGSLWSFPVKSILVVALYCFYGSYWTNVVCWMSHVVVAIPVVFIPLAVFLSHSSQDKSSSGIYVIESDHHFPQQLGIKSPMHRKIDIGVPVDLMEKDAAPSQNNGNSAAGLPPKFLDDEDQRQQAKDNLRFYLGKDIFKYGLNASSIRAKERDDKQIILENEWQGNSISEA